MPAPPVSTTTTPSGPVCTATFAPAPTIMCTLPCTWTARSSPAGTVTGRASGGSAT